MTEETQEEKKFYETSEIDEMLDTSFLPKIQEITKRYKEERYADVDINSYRVNLDLYFRDLENPLTHQDLAAKNQIKIQMTPILQSEVDKAIQDQKQEEEKEEENEVVQEN